MWVWSSVLSSATRGTFRSADVDSAVETGTLGLASRSLSRSAHVSYFVLHSNLCGVGGVLDGLFALCGAGAWGYAAGILQTAVDSNGNLRNEYESSGEVNTANQELQQALNASSASSISPVGEQLTEDYDSVLDQRRAAGIMTWIEFGYACPPLYSIVVMAYSCVLH